MKRRHFFKNTLLLGAGIATASNPSEILASSIISLTKKQQNKMKIVIMTGSPRQNGNTNLYGGTIYKVCYAHEITNPVLLIHGGLAHSRYFSETAFQKMTGKAVEIPTQQEPGKNFSFVEGNKELYIVQGAVHTDLYDDRACVIPYDKIEHFFRDNLK